MEEFKFYIDRKCTCWERETFSIEANTKEEAIEQVIKTIKEGDYFENATAETLYDTIEVMDPEDNRGWATIELYDDAQLDLIWDNTYEE